MPWKSFLSLAVKFASVCLWLEVLVQRKVKNIKVAPKIPVTYTINMLAPYQTFWL